MGGGAPRDLILCTVHDASTQPSQSPGAINPQSSSVHHSFGSPGCQLRHVSDIPLTCVEIKFYGAFVLILRVNLHAIDELPARWRGDAGSSPLDGASAATSSPRSAPDTLADFHTVVDPLPDARLVLLAGLK